MRSLRDLHAGMARRLGLDRSVGCIDSVQGQMLRGWYIARHRHADGNRFRVTLDGHDLGTFTAALNREDLRALQGVLRCGFVVDLGVPLRALLSTGHLRDGASARRLALRSERGRVVASRRVGFRAADGLIDSMIKGSRMRDALVGSGSQGYLDRIDDTGLAGWALDRDRPNDPVDLAVYVDGAELTRVTTSERRADLLAQGMPGASAGFRVQWRAGVLPATAMIDVRFVSGGQSLGNSPGRLEGRAPIAPHLCFMDAYRGGQMRPVTVVVPIHDAFEAATECVDALLRHTRAEVEILLIDDASPDARIGPWLMRLAADAPRCRVLRNEHNLGYTRTINRAIGICEGRDLVLLNSDTVVTPRWLDSLRYCAYSASRVASVTALSNNAGAFSVPEIGVENHAPDGMGGVEYARILTGAGLGRRLDVPTGNGFCLYLRRAALDAVGMFDQAKFPRGYGEENDWCLRALRAGWTHQVCDKAYVFHKRSQSFGEQKQALLSAGSAQVHADYPEYRLLTERFGDVEFSLVRQRMRSALARGEADAGLPTILFVISTLTGGTPQTNLDLMRALRGRYRSLLLSSDGESLTLSRLCPDGSLAVLEVLRLGLRIEPVTHRSDEYDRLVADLLYRHGVEILHVRHIAWHGLGLVDAAKALGLPVFFSVHDFYSICPALKLVDEKLEHCAGRCTAGEGNCQIELWPVGSMPPLKHRFVHRWRDMFRELIGRCDRIISTSPSARSLFLSHFPEAGARFEVIAHGRDFTGFERIAAMPAPREKLRLLVLGNVSPAKGGALLRDFLDIGDDRFELHFLGEVWSGFGTGGVRHGRYAREELATKVQAIRPHLSLILSIWPETYCHTLTESWSLGIPVLGLEIGAVGDRLRESGAGWLLPQASSAMDLRDALSGIIASPADFGDRLEAVYTWQRSEGTQNTTAGMAAAYARLYDEVIDRPGGEGGSDRPGRSRR